MVGLAEMRRRSFLIKKASVFVALLDRKQDSTNRSEKPNGKVTRLKCARSLLLHAKQFHLEELLRKLKLSSHQAGARRLPNRFEHFDCSQ